MLLTLKTNTFGEHCGNGQLLQNRALTKAVRALPRPARPPWEHGRGSHPGANMSQVSTKEDATDVATFTPRCIYTREQIQTCAASRGGSMNESTPQRCAFVSGGAGIVAISGRRSVMHGPRRPLQTSTAQSITFGPPRGSSPENRVQIMHEVYGTFRQRTLTSACLDAG